MVSRRSFLSGAAAASAALIGTGAAGAQPAPPAPVPAPPPPPDPVLVERHLLALGTGRVTGVYFPAGGAICRVVNRDTEGHGLRCLVEPTDGSVANIAALRSGTLDIALVQSDWQQAAWTGTGMFAKEGAFAELRAIASLHADTLTVLVRPDQPVTTFSDLRGRRVNLGPAGSALRVLADQVMAAHGMNVKDLAVARDLAPDRQVDALCDGSIDAALFVVGHPNGAVRDGLIGCGAVPVALDEGAMEKLVAMGSPLVRTVVPARLYPTLDTDVPTVGMAATLVTTAALGEEQGYALTRAIFAGMEELRAEHPALEPLEPARMATEGLTAPLHPGAERYYKEAGLRI